MHDADELWLQRLHGVAMTQWPGPENLLGDKIFLFYEPSVQFSEFISKQDEAYFSGECSYTNLQNKTYSMPVSGIVMHCINHGTFHRGQLITMLRALGVTELPSTDLIAYLRISKKSS